jgi:hypothetical protein
MGIVLQVVVAVFIVAMSPSTSVAATITFDGSNGVVRFAGEIATIEGFDFSVTPGDDRGLPPFDLSTFFFVTDGEGINHNGTPELFLANHSVLTMAQNGGGAFDFLGFDLAGSVIDPAFWILWASSIDVTGTIAGGGSITTNILLPSTAIMQTHTLTGFLGLSSVTFAPRMNAGVGASRNSFSFNLDNINVVPVATVPESASLSLLLIGLGVLTGGLKV